MIRKALVLALLVACSGSEERTADTSSSVTVCPSGPTVEGIDVSYWQGSIDFGKVAAAGKRFAFLRVADGSFVDPKFGTYWTDAKNAGLLVGAYHFFEPAQSASAQANLFLSHMPALAPGDLPPVLDVEITGGQSATTIRNGIDVWINTVAAATGRKPLVYTSPGIWSSGWNSGDIASRADLWVANWGVSCPSTASSWPTWRFWQHDDSGSVWGISGTVDLDRFDGSWEELQAYAGLGSGAFDPDLGAGDLAVGRSADGRLEMFAPGASGELFHKFQIQVNGGWGDWVTRGGSLTSPAAVGTNDDGRLELFARGNDGALWHTWQVTPNGGWSDWTQFPAEVLGGSIAAERPSIGRNADGRLEVFVRGNDSAVWHAWQNANKSWSDWYTMGGAITDAPAVVSNADGRLEVFVRGSDGAVWHDWQVAPSSGWTNAFHPLGGSIDGAPIASNNADGRVEVFARGVNGDLVHAWQIGDGTWSAFWSLGGYVKSIDVGKNADGRLEVFARGSDDGLYDIWQVAPNGGWSGWNPMGGILTTSPAVGANQDGRLEVFTGGTDGAVWHLWQTGNGWSGWASMNGH